jgi:hypothetical protein
MSGFAHRPGDLIGDTALVSPGGYDEESARANEAELVELRGRLAETRGCISYLRGAFEEGVPLELLERIESHVEAAQGDMPRLMCEAKKLMRGE